MQTESLRLSSIVAGVKDGGRTAAVSASDAEWLVDAVATVGLNAATTPAEAAWHAIAAVCCTGDAATSYTRLADASVLAVASATLRRLVVGVDGATEAQVVACLTAVWSMCVGATPLARALREGMLGAVLASMEGNATSSADVASLACAVLSRLCHADVTDWHWQATEMSRAVLAALERHPGSAAVAERGCAALRNISAALAGGGGGGRWIVRDGIGLLLAAMLQHPDEAAVQAQACGALQSIVASQCTVPDAAEAVQAITAAGGVELVLDAMRRHPTGADVQAQGCGVLHTAITRGGVLAGTSGIEAALAAILLNPDDPDVQQRGCTLLKALVDGSDANAVAVAQVGGVEVVVAAMRRHATSTHTQASGCGVLRRLAEAGGSATATEIVGAGGIDVVVAAMRGHQHHADGPAARDMQAEGCAVLRVLASSSSDTRDAIVRCGGREVVQHAIHRFRCSSAALWALDALQ
jgi:hypothetical protein